MTTSFRLVHAMRRRRFLSGLVAGAVVVFGVRALVNATPVADWIVQPLLISDTDGPADAIVVSGAGVIGECIPNRNGTQRVLRAARLWREGRSPYVVVTGGSGPAGCPVATAMSRLLQDVGVPPSRIRVEPASKNTRQNAAIVAPMLRAWGLTRVVLVTDQLHMRRASGAFAAAGVDTERSAVPIFEGHPDNVSMLLAGLREYAALAYYAARGWVGDSSDVGQAAPALRPGFARERPLRPDGPIVILGASYAANLSITRVGGVPIINRGVAGQESSDMLKRFDRDVVALQPRAVLIWGFINDIVRAPLDRMEATTTRIRGNYVAMIERAVAAGIAPVLATEVTLGPPPGLINSVIGWLGAVRGKASYQDRVNRHVLAVDQWLIGVAEERGLLLLDLQPLLAEPGGARRSLFSQPDGSHITTEGYGVLESYAEPILQEYLRDR